MSITPSGPGGQNKTNSPPTEVTCTKFIQLKLHSDLQLSDPTMKTIIIILFVCTVPYNRKDFRSEAQKIHCNTYIFKISLNLYIKTKC